MRTYAALSITCLSLACLSQCAFADYELDDPSEPWLSAHAGVSERVMPPYTALVRKGSQVSCLGRTYELDGLLPKGASSQGQIVLARPIAVQVKLAGRWEELPSGASHFTKEAPDFCEYQLETNLKDLAVSAASRIEYDGLIRTKLTLAGKRPIVVEGLRIEFAFEPSAAIFHHLEARWSSEVFERSPTNEAAIVDYPWTPLIWVGNHDVGFCVVTESSVGWSTAGKGAIQFKREAKALVLTLNVITGARELTSPLTLEFGLMATPAKPMPADRWNYIVGKLPGESVTHLWNKPPEQKYFSYPQPSDFAKTRELVDAAHQEGRRITYYITTSATSVEAAVVKKHYNDWRMGEEILKGAEWKSDSGLIGVGACCPASSFTDFMAWGVDQAMADLDIDGIYIDNPGPYWCYNPSHGCGIDGVRTYPFFALRDLHKRLYTIVKTHKPNGLIWEHTSQSFNPIQLAWVDLYSDGEPWRNTAYYPPVKLFAEFNRTYLDITATGHQVGAVPAYLDSIGARTDGDWSHWLPSRILPYGQMIWSHPRWLDGTLTVAAAQARLDFGLGKEPVKFYRPHELPPWFVFSGRPEPGPEVLACLWQRERDDAVLAVLANWSDHPIELRLNEKQLKARFGNFEVSDATTHVRFPNDYVRISIPANGFRTILIERMSQP